MGFARAADVPVVLIGDIDRGGVIAQPRRHQGGARPRGRRAGARLPRQQVPRRPRPVRRRHGARSRTRPAGSRSASSRSLPTRGCLPAEDALALDAAAPREAATDASASPCRSCRTSPISTISIRCEAEPAVDLVRVRPGAALPGDADLVILPGLEGHHRRPRGVPRAGLDIDLCARIVRRGGTRARPVRRLPDARPQHRRSRRASRGPPATAAGLGLLDVETMLSGDKRLVSAARRQRCGAPLFRLRNAYGRHDGRRLRAPVRPPCRRLARRRNVGRRPRDRHLYPRPVRRRPAALRLA